MLKTISLIFLSALIFSGCIKTRSQIRQEEKVAEIQDKLDTIQTSKADENSNLTQLKEIIARLTGRIEEIEFKNNQNRTSLKSEFESESKQAAERSITIEKRMSQIEQKQAILIDQIKALSDEWRNWQISQKKSAKKVKTAKKSKGGNAKSLYNNALALFRAKKYSSAIEEFKNSLKKSPKGTYAPGSHYHMGESYRSKGQMENAIIEYSKVFESFSKSYWAPFATYKLGLAFKELGKKTEAKKFFQAVESTYPKSKSAGLAKKELKKL